MIPGTTTFRSSTKFSWTNICCVITVGEGLKSDTALSVILVYVDVFEPPVTVGQQLFHMMKKRTNNIRLQVQNSLSKKRFDNLQDTFQVPYSNRMVCSFARQH
jgi:hypothetical protein